MKIPKTSALLGSSGIEEISLSEIRADEQVRSSSSEGFSPDSLRALADSIERIGVQEPIIVIPEPEKDRYREKYRIVCGERRFRAAKMTSRQTIPAIVRTDLTDPKEIMFLQITENAQREGIDAMELARGAEKLHELGMTKAQIATAIGKGVDSVSYLFAMLKMPDFLKREYDNGHLTHSARTCYEYICLYNRDPERCEQCILQLMGAKSDDSDLSGFLDRSLVKKIKAYIEDADAASEAGQEDPAAEEGAANAAEGSDGAADDGGSGFDEDEYPDHEEREHSAEVVMAPAHQKDDSRTAGLGKPDFTDRDTRAGGDLSDRIARGEEDCSAEGFEPEAGADPGEEVEDESLEDEGLGKNYEKLYVVFKGREYRLTYEIGSEPGTIMLLDEDSGGKTAAPIDEITLARGV